MKLKILFFILFLIYIAFLVRLAVFGEGFFSGVIYDSPRYNLALFSDYINVWQKGGISSFLRLFLGNLGWFFPLGFFARFYFVCAKTVKILIFGFLFSLCVEISQFVFKVGVFEIDDLILNTIGVFFGVKFCELFCVKFYKR